jgi:hypothetical protein
MRSFIIAAAVAGLASTASAQVVYDSAWDNGFFLAFNKFSSNTERYGDSGWLGGPGSLPVALDSIKLGMVVYNGGAAPIAAGTTDLSFTLNDGDPSGFVFGSGSTLYSTTIKSMPLPELEPGQLSVVPVSIPLYGTSLLGGFNNVGFSVGVDNFAYDGGLGFQCSSGMTVGFYTVNYSYYNGSAWNLYSLNPIGQFLATMYGTVPAPGALGLLGLAGLSAARRRR